MIGREEYGPLHEISVLIGKLRMLSRACAYAQTHQIIHCFHTQSMEVDEASDQILDLKFCWLGQHGRFFEAIAHMR